MNVKALEIRIGEVRIGILFQYAHEGAAVVVNRFVVDEQFIEKREPPVLSASYLAASPLEQSLLWRDFRSEPFNARLSRDGKSWFLPAFFQNLLPEGAFRSHLAQLRGCEPGDHFELLAACGRDLPGNVFALPARLDRSELASYVTEDNDALEMSVTAEPLEEGVSLSGIQPKLGVNEEGGRYVSRTKEQGTHIIAKLPVVGQPLLPEVEELSLRLARAAGVDACEARLEPLARLAASHQYDLGDADAATNFLVVPRYDRDRGRRVHCEDFAQVLGVMPEEKYAAWHSYLGVAAVLMLYPESLGEKAVHELLRRIVVNEMLGNPDMHLKNIGLLYPDGRTPVLPPAYDIVAHVVFTPSSGHGLRILPPDLAERLPLEARADGRPGKLSMSPAVLRVFCEALGIPEKPAAKAIADGVRAAVERWPGMIEASSLTDRQKHRLLEHFRAHRMAAGLLRRSRARPGG